MDLICILEILLAFLEYIYIFFTIFLFHFEQNLQMELKVITPEKVEFYSQLRKVGFFQTNQLKKKRNYYIY